MSKIIFADECIHKDIIDGLRAEKYQVKTVKEENLNGFSDERIFQHARKRKWILLTFDRGFGDIFRFNHSKNEGTIILLIKNIKKDEICLILKNFLKLDLNIKGKLTIIGKKKIRISEK